MPYKVDHPFLSGLTPLTRERSSRGDTIDIFPAESEREASGREGEGHAGVVRPLGRARDCRHEARERGVTARSEACNERASPANTSGG